MGTIREGSAQVLPVSKPSEPGKNKPDQSVFYNPAQVVNRDLSVLVLNVFSALRSSEEQKRRPEYRGLRILEGLAATGLRSVRYWNEVQGVDTVVANDADATAVAHIRRNLEQNGVPADRVRANHADVGLHLHNNAGAYDVVDLDPYGTASPFLDAAVAGVRAGGLLCITSTDMPVLGGNYPEVSFYRYGGTALKAGYVHEMSLRLLLNAIAAAAARRQRYAEPLLSCSIDFYVRVFVRIHDVPARAKELASTTALVYQCCQCESFHIQRLGLFDRGKHRVPKAVEAVGPCCNECGGRYSIGGPFYAGQLHSAEFVDACLAFCDAQSLEHIVSWRKLTGFLAAANEELLDIPLHYSLPALCGRARLRCAPASKFKGALQLLGYRVSHFHREPGAVKTDAPDAAVFDVLRKWAEHEGKTVGQLEGEAEGKAECDKEAVDGEAEAPGDSCKARKRRADPVAARILAKPIASEQLRAMEFDAITFKEEGRVRRVPRFLPNPEKFWGPKPRARPGRGEASIELN